MFIEIWRRKREGRWALRMKRKRAIQGREGTVVMRRIGGMRRTRKKRKGGELGYGGN
jgi:hypothetical protein